MLEGVPAARMYAYFGAVGRDEGATEFRLGDVPYLAHPIDELDLAVVCQRDGEEQFVVLAAVECRRERRPRSGLYGTPAP